MAQAFCLCHFHIRLSKQLYQLLDILHARCPARGKAYDCMLRVVGLHESVGDLLAELFELRRLYDNELLVRRRIRYIL